MDGKIQLVERVSAQIVLSVSNNDNKKQNYVYG